MLRFNLSALHFVLIFLLVSPYGQVKAGGVDGASKQNNLGASVFRKRCVLCHGLSGLGEGVMPMVVKLYPNTDLTQSRFGVDKNKIRDIINHCKSDERVDKRCAPFGDELDTKEIDALVDFIIEMRTNNAAATQKIMAASFDIKPSLRKGSVLFRVRCATCHGHSGEGNGRLAILYNPPPADFTKSVASDEFIMDIVTKGGKAMGRSPSMPVFEGTVDYAQIKSITLYLNSLRD